MNISDIKEQYPLHYAVFYDNLENIETALSRGCEVDKVDTVGNTPLQLAAILGHTRPALALLENGANAELEDKEGWSILQECVSNGNISLAQKVLDVREAKRLDNRAHTIPELLNKLSNAPDFYAEMRWDFTSWVPLLSRICPSDTYKIYKSGPAVRIDSTLTGFDQNTWKRGNITFLFLANESGCEFHEINHDRKTVTVERIDISSTTSLIHPSIASRLSAPNISTQIKTDNIEFWREKSGIYGFRTDKTEEVSGYECAVYSTSGIEIITRERLEHLTTEQKEAIASNTSLFESLLSGSVVRQWENSDVDGMPIVVDETVENGSLDDRIVDYFNRENVNAIRIKQKQQTDKVQKFKARVWLSQDYPLSLQEQLLPIVELMSTNNTHFSKLKDFITLQLPAGFPVNIEIPLYHMVNARVKFSNINSATNPIDGVLCISGSGERESTTCVVDAHVFNTPPSYYRIGADEIRRSQNESVPYITDDQMLQYAIQQSLMSQNRPSTDGPGMDDEITWVDALRMEEAEQQTTEDDLTRALRISAQEEAEREEEIRKKEEEELNRILELSLQDK